MKVPNEFEKKCIILLFFLIYRVSKVAKKVEAATQAKGMNIISNMEEVSGQTVFHTHVHIIPRYSAQDELAISFTEHEPNFEQLTVLAETIKNS